jgi:hypothetical protein
MSIFLFGCSDIQTSDWILRLNAKCCLDGQSENLQFHETIIITFLYMQLIYLIYHIKIERSNK